MMGEKERADLEMRISFCEKDANNKWHGYVWAIFGFVVVILAAIFSNMVIAILGIALVAIGVLSIFHSDHAKAKLPSLRRQLEAVEAKPTNTATTSPVTNEARYCKYCGQRTSVDAVFCEKCGKGLA